MALREVKFTTVSHFSDFETFNGRNDSRIHKIDEVSVTYCDFGVVREFSALPSILDVMGFNVLKTSCF